jgi:hypothetical protein
MKKYFVAVTLATAVLFTACTPFKISLSDNSSHHLNRKNGKKGILPVGSIGFEIRNKSGMGLAAVPLMDNGKVYISSTDTKERFLLANACTAILLHQTM